MNQEEILNQLTQVFRDTFDDQSIVVSAETTGNDIDDWDSLNHVELLSNIERHFGVKFKLSEINNSKKMQNVGEFARLLESKIKA